MADDKKVTQDDTQAGQHSRGGRLWRGQLRVWTDSAYVGEGVMIVDRIVSTGECYVRCIDNGLKRECIDSDFLLDASKEIS